MRTLKSKLTLEGRGLMFNLPAVFEIHPSNEAGIRFHVQNSTIPAKIENVASTEHCVVLANFQTGAKVALVEHFMASCAICKIDALDVYIKGEGFETPIFDGSAKVWVEEFNKIGFEGEHEISAPIKETVVFREGKSSVIFIPSEKTSIAYAVNFNHPELKFRWAVLNDNIDEIIEARTFGYLKDLETFQKMGFSKGVTYENTVGLTETGYTTELRSEFEPVKHKILDIIGDIYLTGLNPFDLNADILVKEAGHGYHVAAAKKLMSTIGE